MGNQNQTSQNKQSAKTPAKPETAQPAGLESAGQGLEPGMAAAFGDGSSDSQAKRLQDQRFQMAQRQELARQISAVQGNQHLQRLAASVKGAPDLPGKARQISAVQGNQHLQRLAAPVQRAPGLPGGALVKIPYNYAKTIKINKGKYIKLSEITLTMGGSMEEMAAPGGGAPTVEAGGTSTKDARKDALTLKAESKKAADDFFSKKVASLDSSIKPYSKKAAGFSRSDDEAKVNVSYEHGLEIDPFIAQGIQLTTAIEFNLLELKKNPGKTPELTILSAVPKAEISGKAENFPIQGMQANLKGEIAATFEPDWVTLGLLLLETPAGWVLATAAGGIAIVYFTMQDVERRQQLMFKVRASSRAIVKSANTYAMVISGMNVSPSGSFEQKAAAQAKSDLASISAGKKMSVDTYYALVEADNLEDAYYQQAYNKYKARALGDYESKVAREIEAWHDEHWIQSFFAGRYASDDIAAARAAIDEADQSEGQGFLK